MSSPNALSFGLDNRPVFHSPGAKRLFFVAADAVQAITTDPVGAVTGVVLRYGQTWHLFNEPDALSYVLTPETSKNGTLYAVEVAFVVPGQTRAKNELFDTMRETDLVAVLQDRNNRWWFLGQGQPLRLSAQEQKIDNDVNQYVLKLAGRQRDNVREMSTTWVSAVGSLPLSPLVDAVDGASLTVRVETAVNNNGQDGGAGYALPNNFQTTVWGPPTGYVIPDTVGVVFADAGTTVKLPAVGTDGQQHTIKDRSDAASVSAITIDGNGRLIDGFATARITTDSGAMTLTYRSTSWHVTAFVN